MLNNPHETSDLEIPSLAFMLILCPVVIYCILRIELLSCKLSLRVEERSSGKEVGCVELIFMITLPSKFLRVL